jgi:hypothetical protein
MRFANSGPTANPADMSPNSFRGQFAQRPIRSEANSFRTAAAIAGRWSTSYQQDDEDDQEYGTESTAEVRSTIIVAAATKQEHQNEDENNQAHGASPAAHGCNEKGWITKRTETRGIGLTWQGPSREPADDDTEGHPCQCVHISHAVVGDSVGIYPCRTPVGRIDAHPVAHFRGMAKAQTSESMA